MKNIQSLHIIVPLREYTEKEVKKVLLELSKDQQQILELYFEKRLTIKEIAIEMNFPYSSVHNKLHKAIFFLKNKFNPAYFKKAYSILYPETGKPGNQSLLL